jgi:ABC-type multidrug transport system fused ATPase/permease subunit
VIFLIVTPLENIGLPLLYGRFLDKLLARKPVTRLVGMIVAIHILAHLAYIHSEQEESRMFPLLQAFLRQTLLSRIFQHQADDVRELETGKILSVLIKTPGMFYGFLDIWKKTLFPYFLVMALINGYVFYKNTAFGWIMLTIILGFVLVGLWGAWACQEDAMDKDRIFNEMQEDVEEVFRNMMSILNADSFEEESHRMDTRVAEYSYRSSSLLKTQMVFKILLAILEFILIFVFLWKPYKMYRARTITAGEFIAFFFLSSTLQTSLDRILLQFPEVVHRWGVLQESFRTLRHVLSCPPPPPPVAQVAPPQGPSPDALISIRSLWYFYPGATAPAIADLSLDIHRGERVAIVGTIGSGKSTVLRLLLRYHPISSGEIYLEGMPSRSVLPADTRRTMALVPQVPVLFDRSIYENIVYGIHPRPSEERVLALIREVGIDKILLSHGDGIHRRVGKNGSMLSGGQRQIVWILRALLQDPQVLLLDEPTAAIDPQTKQTVQSLLERASIGRTVLMVTHDEFLMSRATRLLRMHAGRLVSDEAKNVASPLSVRS